MPSSPSDTQPTASTTPESTTPESTTPDDERHLTIHDIGPLIEAQWGDIPLREDQQHLERHFQRCAACREQFARMISAARYTM